MTRQRVISYTRFSSRKQAGGDSLRRQTSNALPLERARRQSAALPNLTVLTKRLDGTGRMIGSSRAPAIAVGDLKPGQSAEVDYYPRGHLPGVEKITVEVDYYPRGHLPGVEKITVEVEALISPDSAQFFAELPK